MDYFISIRKKIAPKHMPPYRAPLHELIKNTALSFACSFWLQFLEMLGYGAVKKWLWEVAKTCHASRPMDPLGYKCFNYSSGMRREASLY